MNRSVWLAMLTIILVAAAASPMAGAPLALQTCTFQQGFDGYVGTTDTTLVDWLPDVNNGSAEILDTVRDRRTVSLLRFDLSSIPSNSAVESAQLSLYLTYSDAGTQTRPAQVHSMLGPWVESEATWNQRAAGQSWTGVGPQAGADYTATSEDSVQTGPAGTWLTWDVTALVQTWIRHPATNYGLVLLDPNSYQDPPHGGEFRSYASSEHPTLTWRPQLVVTYNPDTPMADAGADVENWSWTPGTAVTLDASGSHDRPGGNDATLTYAWRFVSQAYGSQLTNADIVPSCPSAPLLPCSSAPLLPCSSAQFVPDTAGDYELELAVTNDIGESAEDRVHVRVLAIPDHPRIWLTAARLSLLQARAAADDPTWQRWKNHVDAGLSEWAYYPAMQYALLYRVLNTSDPTAAAGYADQAILRVQALLGDCPARSFQNTAYCTIELSLSYDWLYDYDGFDDALKAQVRAVVEPRLDWTLDEYNLAFHNEHYLNLIAEGLAGLAFYGDSPRAGVWLNHARYIRFEDLTLPAINFAGRSGGWPEGEQYGHAIMYLVEYVQALLSGSGENLFASSPFFGQLVRHYLHATSNDWAADWGYPYRLLHRRGDMDTRYVTFHDYTRYILLMLVPGLGITAEANLARACLAQGPPGTATDRMSWSTFSVWDFLWGEAGTEAPTPSPSPPPLNPPQLWGGNRGGEPSSPLAQGWERGDRGKRDWWAGEPLAYREEGIGVVYARSSWSPDAVWVTFQAGDHFTSHQHLDQGHFTVYRGGWLAMESGAYDWWCSDHFRNYYHQSIAHNTIAVADPGETFGSVCSGEGPDVNVEGQRAFQGSPYGTEPPSVAAWQKYADVYDTADLTAYRHNPDQVWTHAQGNVTNAYSDKISEFVREFLFVRPGWVVLYDRVRVRDSSLTPRWLLHTNHEPTVSGTQVMVTNGHHLDGQSSLSDLPDGKLFVSTLLPADSVITKLGGPGYDAWVGGRNFPPDLGDRHDPGYWRVEVAPGTPSAEHRFLHVLYVTEASTVEMPPATLVDAGVMQGTHLQDPAGAWLVLFSHSGRPPGGPLTYSYASTRSTRHLLFNLTPGANYLVTAQVNDGTHAITVEPAGTGLLAAVTVQADVSGVLDFSVAPDGSVTPSPCAALRGDVDGSGAVDIVDIMLVASRWHTAMGDPAYEPIYDLNDDGEIDIVDIMLVAVHWGETC